MSTETEQTTVTTHELCRLTGLTFRQVDMWTRAGIIADFRTVRGSGNPRRYDTDWVPALRVAREFSKLVAEAGGGAPNAASVSAVATLVSCLRQDPDAYRGYNLYVSPEGVPYIAWRDAGPSMFLPWTVWGES